jgi:hypothetical protein
MNNTRTRLLAAVVLALALAIMACGQGEGQEPEACTDVMTFVENVTVPEGTEFAPGEAFTATWRVRNDGDCDWTGYQVTFADGEPMGTMAQAIPDTPAGSEVDVSVEMTAPGGEGGYIGRWQVVSPDEVVLGHLTCSILVVGAAEAGGEAAAEEPEEEETPSESGGTGGSSGGTAGDLPQLTISNVVPSDTTVASGSTVSISFVVTNSGSVMAEDFDIIVIPEYSPSGPNNPLEPSHIDQLSPGMAADLTYEAWFGTTGERTIRILASYDWYEDGDAEPGPGEDAEDVVITVQ